MGRKLAVPYQENVQFASEYTRSSILTRQFPPRWLLGKGLTKRCSLNLVAGKGRERDSAPQIWLDGNSWDWIRVFHFSLLRSFSSSIFHVVCEFYLFIYFFDFLFILFQFGVETGSFDVMQAGKKNQVTYIGLNKC